MIAAFTFQLYLFKSVKSSDSSKYHLKTKNSIKIDMKYNWTRFRVRRRWIDWAIQYRDLQWFQMYDKRYMSVFSQSQQLQVDGDILKYLRSLQAFLILDSTLLSFRNEQFWKTDWLNLLVLSSTRFAERFSNSLNWSKGKGVGLGRPR